MGKYVVTFIEIISLIFLTFINCALLFTMDPIIVVFLPTSILLTYTYFSARRSKNKVRGYSNRVKNYKDDSSWDVYDSNDDNFC